MDPTYKAIFHTLPIGAVVVERRSPEEFIIIDANAAVVQAGNGCASEPEALIGKNVADIFGSTGEIELFDVFNKVLTGETIRLDLSTCKKPGVSSNFFDIELMPLSEDRLLLSFVNSTRHKRAEEALRESEERYQTLLNHLPVGVYRTTPAGRIKEANPAIATLLGMDSVAELQQYAVQELYHDPGERAQHIEILSSDSFHVAEYQLKRPDGTLIWVRDYPRAFKNEQEELEFIDGILIDITDRKQAQEALAEKAAALKRSNEELE
ncbi:MAG: PAS domain-containing protein, partial [Rhodothermales bacterium]